MGAPQAFVRKGSCNRCGQCCERAAEIGYTQFHENPKAVSDAAETESTESRPAVRWREDVPVVAEHWAGQWVFWQQKVTDLSGPCPGYDGAGVCRQFHKLREYPDAYEICCKWPVIPEELAEYPNCGFYFEPLEVEVSVE